MLHKTPLIFKATQLRHKSKKSSIGPNIPQSSNHPILELIPSTTPPTALIRRTLTLPIQTYPQNSANANAELNAVMAELGSCGSPSAVDQRVSADEPHEVCVVHRQNNLHLKNDALDVKGDEDITRDANGFGLCAEPELENRDCVNHQQNKSQGEMQMCGMVLVGTAIQVQCKILRPRLIDLSLRTKACSSGRLS